MKHPRVSVYKRGVCLTVQIRWTPLSRGCVTTWYSQCGQDLPVFCWLPQSRWYAFPASRSPYTAPSPLQCSQRISDPVNHTVCYHLRQGGYGFACLSVCLSVWLWAGIWSDKCVGLKWINERKNMKNSENS